LITLLKLPADSEACTKRCGCPMKPFQLQYEYFWP